mgnify:CR=1 FL=1
MRRILYGALAASLLSGAALADGEVNIYSSRHYDTDDALYSDFEEQTGIKVNRIEDGADKLIERMRAEGVTIVEASAEDRALISELLTPMWDEFVAQNGGAGSAAEALVADIRETRDRLNAMSDEEILALPPVDELR